MMCRHFCSQDEIQKGNREKDSKGLFWVLFNWNVMRSNKKVNLDTWGLLMDLQDLCRNRKASFGVWVVRRTAGDRSLGKLNSVPERTSPEEKQLLIYKANEVKSQLLSNGYCLFPLLFPHKRVLNFWSLSYLSQGGETGRERKGEKTQTCPFSNCWLPAWS